MAKRTSIKKVKPAAAPKRKLLARRGAVRHAQRGVEKIFASNPGGAGGLAGIAQEALPAFGAYAATRFASRIAYVQLSARTKNAKHLSVLASLASTIAAYLAGRHVKSLHRYDDALLLGSAVATLQAIIQTYVPKFGWIVSDYAAPPGMVVLPAGARQRRVAGGAGRTAPVAYAAPAPAFATPAQPDPVESFAADDFGEDELEPIPRGEPGSLIVEDDEDYGSLGANGGSLGDDEAGGLSGGSFAN